MIHALAYRIANYVAKKDKTADHEILTYGYSLIIMGFATYSAVIISALLFGVLIEMLIAIGVFMLMRTTIGGCHANHRAVCFFTYSGTLYLSIFLANVLTLDWYVVLAMYFVNVVLLILYAPGDTVEQPMVRYRHIRKVLGVIFLTFLFAISIYFRDMRIEMNILLFVSTLTCVFLHPYIYRVYGCLKP